MSVRQKIFGTTFTQGTLKLTRRMPKRIVACTLIERVDQQSCICDSREHRCMMSAQHD
jgi:hypothetical protein